MAVTKIIKRSSDEQQRMICTQCLKPNATRHYQSKKRKDGSVDRYMIYEHPDEPPVGEYIHKGKKHPRYRQCNAGIVRTVSNLSDLLLPDPSSEPETTESEAKPKPKPKPEQQYKERNRRLNALLDELHRLDRKAKSVFTEYCRAAKEEFGMSGRETWKYMYSRLKDKIAKSTLYEWGNKFLPEGTMMVTKPKNSTTKIPEPESSTSQRSLPQKQLEEKQQGVPGRINQAPDDYDINQLEDYDAEYLRKIVRWNHEGRETLIKASFKSQTKFDEMKASRIKHEAEIATLQKENVELHKKLKGTWDISPDKYDIKNIHQYGNDLLIKIVKMLDKNNRALMDKYMYWDGVQDKLNKENKELKDRNEELRKQVVTLETPEEEI